MGNLIQFILRLLGMGDRASIERLIKNVVLKRMGSSATGSGGSTGNPLDGLMEQFKNKGLGDVFQSWVGTGRNAPISPRQVADGMGEERMREMSQQTGLPQPALAEKLAQYLPGLIDRMTPKGKIQ
jgi:uncharacterized protein YidB (DUF937 family)